MTNEEAIGYFLVACKNLDVNLIDAQGIMNQMRRGFDELTPEEAVEIGNEWYQKKWNGPKK
ncbi:MAG: hypothetical protein EOM12_12365 [Verrucomicrobiae bacterium]|nr:hypothetical protein [Verrucomicrobiae bacterium]